MDLLKISQIRVSGLKGMTFPDWNLDLSGEGGSKNLDLSSEGMLEPYSEMDSSLKFNQMPPTPLRG